VGLRFGVRNLVDLVLWEQRKAFCCCFTPCACVRACVRVFITVRSCGLEILVKNFG
jgi:hypothetical protein